MIKNTRVHIIISFVIIIVAIIIVWVLRAAVVIEEGLDEREFNKFYDPSTTTATTDTYKTLKETNKNIVDKISQIYTQCTNKNFPSMKTTCTNLINFLNDARTACDDLGLKYVSQDSFKNEYVQVSYFVYMSTAIDSIRVKANDMKTYLTNVNPRVGDTTALNKFNENNFITGFRDGGLIYEELCKEIYNFLESETTIKRIFHKSNKLVRRPPVTGPYFYEDQTELVLTSPFQFYCRRR